MQINNAIVSVSDSGYSLIVRLSSLAAILVVLAALAFSRSLHAEAGLLAHWTFDEEFEGTAQSETGNFHGQVVNGERVAGRIGAGALRLNGTNSYMLVGGENTVIALTNTPYTITWWQKSENLTGTRYVYAMEDGGADQSGGYSAYFSTYNQGELWIHHFTAAFSQLALATGAKVRSEWEHFATVYDGQVLRFYENGMLVAQTKKTALVQDGDDPLVIGALRRQDGVFQRFFSGLLDDFRIYNVALTTAQIRALGQPPGIAITQQPVGYRLGVNSSVKLEVDALPISTDVPLSYEWELNGQPIFVSGKTLTIRPSQTGTFRYRAVVRAGDVSARSDEAVVQVVPQSSPRLLLHYEFESDTGNTIVDSTGQFNGTSIEILHVPGRVGKLAAAFNFGGRERYIHVPAAGTDLELIAGAYTIAWWMPIAGGTLPQPPMELPLSAALAQRPARVFELGDHHMDFRSSRTPGYFAELLLDRIHTYHGSAEPVVLTSQMAAENLWKHVALVFNSSSNLLYLNGHIVKSAPAGDGLAATGQDDLYIGRTTTLQSFTGFIDDFRVYNYALTEAQINGLANVPLPESNLTINRMVDGLMLTWQSSSSAEVLESSGSMAPNSQWTQVSESVPGRNTLYQLRIEPSDSTTFYRARRL
jgi:hypothetical protein